MSQQETFEWLRQRSEHLGKLEEAMAGWCSTHGSFEPDTGGRCPQCTAGMLRVTQAVLGRAEEPPPGDPPCAKHEAMLKTLNNELAAAYRARDQAEERALRAEDTLRLRASTSPVAPELSDEQVEAIREVMTLTLPQESLQFDGQPNFRPSADLVRRAWQAAQRQKP